MENLVCRIELHKKNGITITVVNDADQIVQTMEFDGKVITTTCKGSSETSTITQKPESITIKCKDFLVDAETITCNSSKDTKLDSKAKTDISSSQDFTVNSGATAKVTATSEMILTGSKVDIKGKTGDVSVDGMNVKLNATSDVTVEGLNVGVKGKVKTDMEGAMVSVKSNGTLDVKGSMTTVEGSALLKLGGGLVKIG